MANTHRLKGNEARNPEMLEKWRQGRRQELQELQAAAKDAEGFGKSEMCASLLAQAPTLAKKMDRCRQPSSLAAIVFKASGKQI